MALAIAGPSRAETLPWSVEDIGSLGGTVISAIALNDAGQVVGFSSVEGDLGLHAFLFDGDEMTDLGTFGGSNSVASAINSFGVVAGSARVSGDQITKAFIYREGRKVRLGSLGGQNSAALGINDLGDVVGYSDINSKHQTHAFLFRDGTMEDISTVGVTPSFASDINNKRQVIGLASFEGESGFHGFLYRNGHMRDLGAFSPTSINDRSEVVGGMQTPDGYRTVIFHGGKLHIVRALANAETYAYSINNCGEVAGALLDASGLHPFVYTEGQLLNLNSVLPNTFPLHMTLFIAYAINNLGQVIVDGQDTETGESHSYLLTPPATSRCADGRGKDHASKATCPCSKSQD